MLILANIERLYEHLRDEEGLHGKVDLHVDGGRIHAIKPHDGKLLAKRGRARQRCGRYGGPRGRDRAGQRRRPVDCSGSR
jgi:hypothetical protein